MTFLSCANVFIKQSFQGIRCISLRNFSISTQRRGFEEFFENGEALPIPKDKVIYGRAWKASELRNKSFDDLHKLWFVLLKERNLLATQESEARRLEQIWFGKHREWKCKQSMARIKSVLSERQAIHNKSLQLISMKESNAAQSEGDLLLTQNQRTIHKRAEIKRRIRKALNYHKRRQPLFA